VLPDLIVIGAQKCGTTSLHHYLDAHPEVAMSQPKELDFFIGRDGWARGRAWYEEHFKSSPAAIRGESSPSYTNYPRYRCVPERIAQMVPDARLIYVVRDPIARIVSNYIHSYANGETRRGIDAELGDLRNSDYVGQSLYFTQLRRYLRVFPAERILVIAQEDLLNDRLGTLRRVFAFLGVAEDFVSPRFDREHHPSATKQADGREIPVPRVDGALRRRLVERLRADAELLRAHTGLELETWTV
jgi:hypothetical protein